MNSQQQTDQAAVIPVTTSSGGHSFSYHKPIIQNKLPPGRGGASCIYVSILVP
jgi:hypothetical protein